MPVETAGAVVLDRPEQRTVGITTMSGPRQILLDGPLRGRIDGDEADLGALAFDLKMHDALAAVHILDPQPAEFFAPDAVVQQGRENSPVARTLERVRGRGFQQLACLPVAESRGTAFIAERALFHVLAPADDMGADDRTQFQIIAQDAPL